MNRSPYVEKGAAKAREKSMTDYRAGYKAARNNEPLPTDATPAYRTGYEEAQEVSP